MPPLVFDLDGTISNPAVGFARSINFALGAFGYPAIDEEDVSQYIGPPLEASIRRMAPGASAAAERAGRTSLVRVMSDPVDDLIIDLLEWIGPEARAYGEVMDAWRTSCPRLPVWEEANDRGFVERQHRDGHGTFVSVTALGREFVDNHRLHGIAPADQRDSFVDPKVSRHVAMSRNLGDDAKPGQVWTVQLAIEESKK